MKKILTVILSVIVFVGAFILTNNVIAKSINKNKIVKFDNNLVLKHYSDLYANGSDNFNSHTSHYSHSSHRSHYSHYSHYSSR